MYDSKGKPAGLMAEGSMAYMESISQEKSNLMQDMPIDNRGVSQMSPYKLHGNPNTPHPDPKKKATTTLSNALASDEDYEVVPGFEERLGGELEEVVVTAPATTNASRISSIGKEVTTPHPGRYVPYAGGKAGRKSFKKRKDYKAYKEHHETQKEKYFKDPINWKSTYKN